MKPNRLAMLASAALAGATLMVAPSLLAAARPKAEHRLTGEEIKSLAAKEMVWCDVYEARTDDCQTVTLVGLLSDGRVSQTISWLVEVKPRLQVFVGDTDKIEGDRICSVMNTEAMPIAFTLEGKAVSEPLASQMRETLMHLYAPLQGKKVCQAFYRGADPNRLREEVTVNGRRRKDLESTYVLRSGEEGFVLRPDGDQKTKGTAT